MLLKRFSSARRPKGFDRFEREAESLARNPEQIRSLVQTSFEKISRYRREIGKIGAELPILLRLVRAYAAGEYRRIPLKAIVMILGAALYFVNPLDLIPDFLPVIGYVDDAAVIAYVLKSLRREVDLFADWESDRVLSD